MFRDKVRKTRLRWFRHVQKGDGGHTGQRMLNMAREKEDDHRGASGMQ